MRDVASTLPVARNSPASQSPVTDRPGIAVCSLGSALAAASPAHLIPVVASTRPASPCRVFLLASSHLLRACPRCTPRVMPCPCAPAVPPPAGAQCFTRLPVVFHPPCERMSDMANGDYPSRPSTYGDLFERLDRIEDKLDRRLDQLDAKVDRVDLMVDTATSRMDRLEGQLTGSLSLIKWIGPAGIAALVYGLLVSQGFI